MRHQPPTSSNSTSNRCSRHRISANSRTSVSSSISINPRTSARDSHHMRTPLWEEGTNTHPHPHTTPEDTHRGPPMHRSADPRTNHRCNQDPWDGANVTRSRHPWVRINSGLVDETTRQWM